MIEIYQILYMPNKKYLYQGGFKIYQVTDVWYINMHRRLRLSEKNNSTLRHSSS